MQGLLLDHVKFLIKCEDRERPDSRGMMTNFLLYSESLTCKGLADRSGIELVMGWNGFYLAWVAKARASLTVGFSSVSGQSLTNSIENSSWLPKLKSPDFKPIPFSGRQSRDFRASRGGRIQ